MSGAYGCRRLEGRVALVVAATRGIGLACARALAAEGAEVYLGGRRPQANEEAAAAIRAEGGRAGAVYFDALKPESYAAMIGETVGKSGGRLHILVNNYGGTRPETDKDVAGTDAEHFQADVLNHVNSVFLAVKHALPYLETAGGGSVINVSSMASVLPDVTRIGYTTAKAAVNSMTRNIAAQYGRKGIRCNAVLPGMTATDAVADNLSPEFIASVLRHIPLGRMGTPEDIARAVCFLASDDSAYITGQCLEVAGGLGVPTPFYADMTDGAHN
ncbi:MAG TPA: SDR family oxidoreductase [Candidatus Mailhella merdigallinarum]|uniref:SDR family oxidoreductase n=1 Tax=Candidatus Mailhella merdigallinarum TaxID=2838658 RepID=A0A9D2HDL6_9BACT|nr:SDR family oxidoreductase [Desulfovibrionaceae bacterium]HJA08487.1 SDR family oxidoreductase [Candidatus Mailhella merdigallinarum]